MKTYFRENGNKVTEFENDLEIVTFSKLCKESPEALTTPGEVGEWALEQMTEIFGSAHTE